MIAFEGYPKIPRLKKEMIVTEKLDGTNAQILIVSFVDPLLDPEEVARINGAVVYVTTGHLVFAGSRNRWLQVGNDNFGFASWVRDNASGLVGLLGEGRHFGEWWGKGIQRGYGLDHRVFSLFDVSRWGKFGYPGIDHLMEGLSVVPTLYEGAFDSSVIGDVMEYLGFSGSHATAGVFGAPEGVVVFHTGANQLFKYTFEDGRKG